jgi:hypothetical protein
MSHKITKVTKTEFETDDGTVHPVMFELDEIPSVDEFQKIYDEWLQVFQDKELLEAHGSKIS